MTNANEPYVYADSAATTPLSPRALEAMMPYLTTKFGNPSGIHRMARETASALDGARNDMARLLGAANASDIYFTSGGSESDNWILRGAVQRYRDLYGAATPVRIVTSAIEHHAILHCCEALEREGVQVTHLPVDRQGLVHAEDLEEALTANERAAACGIEAPGFAAAPGHTTASAGGDAPGLATPPATALVSIMLANNEVGTIEPIRELAAVAHAHGAPFHTDAVQAVGHIPVDVQELGIDALSLSAHKFHGPRGVGALYLRKGFSIPSLITGGARNAVSAPVPRTSQASWAWSPPSRKRAKRSGPTSCASHPYAMSSFATFSARSRTWPSPARQSNTPQPMARKPRAPRPAMRQLSRTAMHQSPAPQMAARPVNPALPPTERP